MTNALNISADVRTLDSDIGSSRAKTTLTTTSKNIVGIINELDAEPDSALVGNLTSMTVEELNKLDSNLDSASTELEQTLQTHLGIQYLRILEVILLTVQMVQSQLLETVLFKLVYLKQLLIDHTVVGATDVNNMVKHLYKILLWTLRVTSLQ